MLVSGDWELDDGSVATIVEDALAITSEGRLYATRVPMIARTYKVHDEKSRDRLDFAVYKLPYIAANALAESFRRLPDAAEGWAGLDLPNVPPSDGVALRAH